ncbi:hypothetical protein H6P81_016364 [Aristolochia fimbriata]|uniref:Uncharacterized protein n=1 Tax=Aristolochia fimbriata TaxID=158543 RepID=A0AAV7E8I5_ARIFI|nr:hypothetical protein H6P81_016364 [Aristolochia fimbriata]
MAAPSVSLINGLRAFDHTVTVGEEPVLTFALYMEGDASRLTYCPSGESVFGGHVVKPPSLVDRSLPYRSLSRSLATGDRVFFLPCPGSFEDEAVAAGPDTFALQSALLVANWPPRTLQDRFMDGEVVQAFLALDTTSSVSYREKKTRSIWRHSFRSGYPGSCFVLPAATIYSLWSSRWRASWLLGSVLPWPAPPWLAPPWPALPWLVSAEVYGTRPLGHCRLLSGLTCIPRWPYIFTHTGKTLKGSVVQICDLWARANQREATSLSELVTLWEASFIHPFGRLDLPLPGRPTQDPGTTFAYYTWWREHVSPRFQRRLEQTISEVAGSDGEDEDYDSDWCHPRRRRPKGKKPVSATSKKKARVEVQPTSLPSPPTFLPPISEEAAEEATIEEEAPAPVFQEEAPALVFQEETPAPVVEEVVEIEAPTVQEEASVVQEEAPTPAVEAPAPAIEEVAEVVQEEISAAIEEVVEVVPAVEEDSIGYTQRLQALKAIENLAGERASRTSKDSAESDARGASDVLTSKLDNAEIALDDAAEDLSRAELDHEDARKHLELAKEQFESTKIKVVYFATQVEQIERVYRRRRRPFLKSSGRWRRLLPCLLSVHLRRQLFCR